MLRHTSLILAALVGLSVAAQAATVTFTTTYTIAAGATYNGAGNTIKAVGMGDGSQSESQKPFFVLKAGSTLSSVVLSAPGVDGVHYHGNGTITNVKWSDIGEDASTIKSAGTCTLSSSSGTSAADKFLQCNAASTWTLSAVRQTTSLKVLRQLGGSTFTANFYYNYVTSTNCGEGIGRTDSSTSHFYYRGITATSFGGSSGWWYGRSSQSSTY